MRIFKRIIFGSAAFILITGVVLFFLKDYILSTQVRKATERFHKQTGGYLEIKESAFVNFPGFSLKHIVITDSLRKPVIEIKNISARIALKKLLRFRMGLSTLEIDTLKANFIRDSSYANYDFLFRKSKPDSELNQDIQKRTIAFLINRIFENLDDVNKLKADLTEVKILFRYNGSVTRLHSPYASLNKGLFNMSVIDESFVRRTNWDLKGEIKKGNRGIEFMLKKNGSNEMNYFPLLNVKDKLNIGSNRIFVSIQDIKTSAQSSSFVFSAAIDSFRINHWRIASNPVMIDSLQCRLNCTVSGNKISFDTTSTAQINKLPTKISFGYEAEKTVHTKLNLRFNTTANDFFHSLPQALFFAFEGMEFKGFLNYNLSFEVDTSQLNNLVFNSNLKGINFGVTKYGITYFPKMNQSFLYDAYDGDRFVKSFWVGPENPDFVSINNISTHLQYAVLTSEDPSFFYHRGFVEEAFRASIIENLKARRFVRGGSTISMQLVKNVFLTREKNIARKLQEALIVWLIENNGITSKDRMFEIYLNAIEWGPNVYGIKQASWFYFKKHPSEITLAESIYLASIIPRPRYFKYNFDKEGKLKPYLGSYYRLITNRMLSKTWITPFDTFNLQPQVVLKGDALKLILPEMRPPPDSPENANDIF